MHRPRHLLRLLCLLLLLPGATLLFAPATGSAPAQAQDRSLRISAFDVEVDVARDGTVEVEERIRFDFRGSWNGIFRNIPVEYRTPQGARYTLRLELLSVEDGDGTGLRHEVSRSGNDKEVKVWVPDARDREETVVLRYRVDNGLRFFDEYDELYWNVTGTEWEVPIARATARIRLPDGVAGLRSASFRGGYGSTAPGAEAEELEDGFYFETERPLNFKEGLTVAVAWDPGVVERPTRAERVLELLRMWWPALLPLLAAAMMGHLWYHRGRDPALRPVHPRYEPPEGLTPGEVGTVVDDRPNLRDVTATLVDLAVRGHLRIEEKEPEHGLWSVLGHPEYIFHRVTDASEWESLQEHERLLMKGIFGSGSAETVALESLETEFYEDLKEIRESLYDRMVRLGFYRSRPDKVITRWAGLGAFVIFAGTPAAWVLSSIVGSAPVVTVTGVVITGLVIIGFSNFMPTKTKKGTRILEEVLGFEEFLRRVEEEHFKRVIDSPDKFEKYLSYAMALQVDRKWARAFEDMYTQPPDWYVGSSPGSTFHTTAFVTRLGNMSAAAGSTMQSQPRSSGGSGFSGGGGGFSGGGFGGGGGGGF